MLVQILLIKIMICSSNIEQANQIDNHIISQTNENIILTPFTKEEENLYNDLIKAKEHFDYIVNKVLFLSKYKQKPFFSYVLLSSEKRYSKIEIINLCTMITKLTNDTLIMVELENCIRNVKTKDNKFFLLDLYLKCFNTVGKTYFQLEKELEFIINKK